nr:PHD and RING finger domain-containing protein 1 isoform X1 [Misgurnus anguillicaudatus]XP_055048281.1 PHD and RING finger domain-containing protein 1 isoform X1 [Misgurnus anguillicaudatus]XP_055048282.1 PHD and RING finger domain-containing protein 1 isoform X1 [Misgurnus anguillicaudatus]
MDEDDSQDELINRNVSHGKGKRPAMSIVSDDEDNSEDEGESEEEETDSEEDADGEEVLDGEEEDDGEEDDSEDEDSGKVLEGAVGNVPVEAADLSSDEDSEKCPICLNSFHEQPIATPEACEHYFCLDCLLEWSKNANSCPVDRKVFYNIFLRKCYNGKVQKTIAVQKPIKPGQEEQVDVDLDQTSCEVCGGRDREDRLLLCDGCDAGYHMECLTPPLDAVPVEEWFCPDCTPNNRNSGSDQVSEEDSSSLPTTSHSRSRPTRAIARTQHSERVRANVNRHRITQARTAAQLAPRYLMQSTWLDDTINAVVAGLNTAVYVRDLTPRPKPRRKRRTVKRRKTKGKSSAASGGKTNLGVKRRRRKVRKSKSRRKLVVKNKTNSRGRIARSLGIRKPRSGSTIPSVYRPSESSLGSMRAEIGAASFSVYGDPFDLDPFDDREEEIEVQTPLSVLDAKRRGLSRSALRSHQPVARPITAGLSRSGGVSIPHLAEVGAEAPVPDLLGSILSGQSMLLMDSSDVVINRDGSLKATKPVCLSLPRSTVPRESSSGETASLPNSETSPFHNGEGAGPSSSPLSSSGSCSTPQNPTSPCPPINSPHLPFSFPSSTGHPRLHPGPSSKPVALNPQRPGNGIRGLSDTQHQDKGSTPRQPPVKKPPPKPVWVDVSILPRIPKIKKEGTSSGNNSGGGSSLPESSVTSLAGNTGRAHTVDQQGTSNREPDRRVDAQRQRPDRAGASSTFSSSFTSTSSSVGASSNSRPSSSSVSFRINSSGNPWHARRLSASGGTLPGNNEETVKRNDKRKKMMMSFRSQSKEVKKETYDPFDPTGSDSSDNEPENQGPDVSTPNTSVPVGPNEDACHQVKSEPVDVDFMDVESDSEICPLVKMEPESSSESRQSPYQLETVQFDTPNVGDSSSWEVKFENDHSGQQENLFKKNSESSSSCNVKNVTIKVKSEPGTEPLSDSPQSKSLKEEHPVNLQQSSKGNMMSKGPSPVGEPCNAANIIAKENRERTHKSESKDRRRSPSDSQSPPKDAHKKKHSKSKDKRRSRSKSRDRHQSDSKSRERPRSRSRSRERKRPRSRDRRRSSSSSSRERKTRRKRASRERSDSRGRERHRKRSKEKKRSRSRSHSRSRSRERRKRSKDYAERSKRRKSRSRSRDRKRREDRSESSRYTDKISYKADHMSTEKKETSLNANKTIAHSKVVEKDLRAFECKSSLSLPSVKEEVQSVKSPTPGSSRHGDQTEMLTETKKDTSLEVSDELKMFKPKEVKQEKPWPIGKVKELEDIKKEEELSGGEFDADKDTKTETFTSQIFNEEFPELNEIKSDIIDLEKSQACNPEDETKNMNVDQIWPDEDNSPRCSDNPLVISLDAPDANSENCKKESMEPNWSPPFMDEIEVTLAEPSDPMKQDPVNTSDEDINVDYLIDNLDFIKKEMSESSAANSTDVVEEASATDKPTTEFASSGGKSKSQGKRVTWNLQEPEPQSDKMSKIALFKLKLKQEGFRRSTVAPQTSVQDKAQAELTENVSSPLSQDKPSRRKSQKEEVFQDPQQKEMYMKKLHMQERAIEEVKLAIKPFYQKRDITKEEYKEILRKAVQKVCHSKSGEINPVKVANLVKAYVDKYKHARKHKKEDSGQSQHTDTSNSID